MIEAEVIKTDATASKFMIKHDLKYTLNNANKNCLAFEKNISTINSYDAKSAGYSFGTDLVEKESSIKKMKPLIHVPFRFTFRGSDIIYYEKEG